MVSLRQLVRAVYPGSSHIHKVAERMLNRIDMAGLACLFFLFFTWGTSSPVVEVTPIAPESGATKPASLGSMAGLFARQNNCPVEYREHAHLSYSVSRV